MTFSGLLNDLLERLLVTSNVWGWKGHFESPGKYIINQMYGIFTYIDPIKINHSWIGKYTVRPMDCMGTNPSRVFSQTIDPNLRDILDLVGTHVMFDPRDLHRMVSWNLKTMRKKVRWLEHPLLTIWEYDDWCLGGDQLPSVMILTPWWGGIWTPKT